ncbi:MAG: 3-hydroxyacyl-CoA dehydrogenase NAD-binding domain-containing protein, partial [Terracidiphilus sp.]
KRELFGRLHELLASETIVTSNTSTIPIGKLAESMPSPERFCGLHFCHPVRERPLVEIVRGAKTGDETIATLAAHAKAIDKLPVVVADSPGFLVNRLLLPYLAEALELLMEGASIEMIENAALEFGMAKGPFRLMDALIKLGRLGQKSGAGFFSYADPSSSAKPAKPDPATIEIVARWVKTSHQHSAENIILRLLLPMILEAARILEESSAWHGHPAREECEHWQDASGTLRDPRDIDLAVIFGLGFPARRGGLLWWADTIKPAALLEMLRPLERIGPRWQPTRLLTELAAQGRRFY